MNNDMKARKEAFVTGHEGSDHPWEILWVCSSVLWGCWLYAELALALLVVGTSTSTSNSNSSANNNKHYDKHYAFLLEAIAVWFPMILAQTKFLYPHGSFVMVGQILAAGLLSKMRTRRRMRSRATSRTKIKTNTTNEEEESSSSSPSPPSPSRNEQEQEQPSSIRAQPIPIPIPIQHTSQPIEYLTLYRSSIYYLTFVGILAVDFNVFPRRFCKTEISGYGLMDVGAASFCVMGGIVSGKGWYGSSSNRDSNSSNAPTSTSSPSIRSFFKPLVKAAPLLIIGIVRTVTTKELEYQEHVTEYGVHWNFFFTLGVLAIVPTLRKQLLLARTVTETTIEMETEQEETEPRNDNDDTKTSKQQHSTSTSALPEFVKQAIAWAPIVVMVLYQCELSSRQEQLQRFIETAPRSTRNSTNSIGNNNEHSALALLWLDFFLANREGILGCIGYVFLHTVGEWIGRRFVFGNGGDGNRSLGGLAIALWMIWYVLVAEGAGGPVLLPVPVPVSRRSTNLVFCIWALAHNATSLWGCQRLEKWWMRTTTTTMAATTTTTTTTTLLSQHTQTTPSIVPPTFRAVNRNGMVAFLVANVCTGLVNLTIPTLETNDCAALAILLLYVAVVGVSARLVDSLRNRISGSGGGTEGSPSSKTKSA